MQKNNLLNPELATKTLRSPQLTSTAPGPSASPDSKITVGAPAEDPSLYEFTANTVYGYL
jgi:hypothetical protein